MQPTKPAFVLIPTHKRANPFNFVSPMKDKNGKDINTPSRTLTFGRKQRAAEKIQQSRQLLIEAACELGKGGGLEKEQTEVLNLLDIFRQYTETNTVPKILAQQLSSLEHTTKQLKDTTKRATFAQVAASNPNPNTRDTSLNSRPSIQTLGTTETSWQTVAKRKTSIPKLGKLVLETTDKTFEFKPIELRNKANKILQDKGQTGQPGILSIYKSKAGNLVLTVADQSARADIAKHIDLFRGIGPICGLIEDNTWFKVAVHGVPTSEYKEVADLVRIQEEIETYNIGLKPIATPIWLSSKENRSIHLGASILVAFRTEDEARHAIQSRLFIGGVSCKVEKAKDRPRPIRTPIEPTMPLEC